MEFFHDLNKKLIAIIFILLAFGLILYVGMQNRPKMYADTLPGTVTEGVYTATEEGFAGPVTVTVEVANSAIASIDIVGEGETPNIGGAAIEELKTAIYDTQSPYVDSVSGATYTSTAVIKATENALEQAGADTVAMGKPKTAE